jgi:hypothetical protein
MDDLQQRLARIALSAIADRGFVLGGGHAVELHGMGSRPSEDIDLFSAHRGAPGEVEADLVAEYEKRA